LVGVERKRNEWSVKGRFVRRWWWCFEREAREGTALDGSNWKHRNTIPLEFPSFCATFYFFSFFLPNRDSFIHGFNVFNLLAFFFSFFEIITQ